MQKATPAQIRQSLKMAESLKKAGIRFVPMPVLDESEFQMRLRTFYSRLEEICEIAEREDGE